MALKTINNPVFMIGDTLADQPAHPTQNAFFFDKSRNQTAFYNGVEWSVRGTTAIKTADTSRTSDVLVNDPHLNILVVHNAKYALDSYLIYNAPTAADINFAWTAPAGSTLDWSTYALPIGEAGPTGPLDVSSVPVNIDLGAGGGGPVGNLSASARGILTVSSTPGTFFLKWGQKSTNASASTLIRNSWINLTRIA
jgi:hypothetical protein